MIPENQNTVFPFLKCQNLNMLLKITGKKFIVTKLKIQYKISEN